MVQDMITNDSLFPRVRLLDLMKDDKYGVLERFKALKMRRLYLKKINIKWEASGVFIGRVQHDSFCAI